MSELKAQLTAAMKDAMRAKDKLRLGTVRMALAALNQKEIDERVVLTDADVLAIVTKLVKQRDDSATQFRDAGRPELADQEEAEAEILKTFLPSPLSEDELAALIDQAMSEIGATSMAQMGAVMAWLRPHVTGRADLGQLSGKIKSRLG
ncbi:GatB/YqeY domain-containing protein [Litorivicinus lipolyticus]|uniref:GatB/YqeY domain-containing protein n=1 Tax=Litorivicinus lipolyticus TaxID=418701 RepID=A0A5Q2QGK4_9GAMM|nr:GatB/YqeY domain-containing protein [Litorivicinus lipolyticus]QGG81117.1 GatB/YqeY domain-containing protein [Litorivicinus lipolyticus]